MERATNSHRTDAREDAAARLSSRSRRAMARVYLTVQRNQGNDRQRNENNDLICFAVFFSRHLIASESIILMMD